MALTEDKFHAKQAQLVQRTSEALKVSLEEATLLLRTPRQQSVRINTLKTSKDNQNKNIMHSFKNVAFIESGLMDEGYFIESGLASLRDSAEVEKGELYIQNAASWLPVLALNPQPGQKVLDMCAAPGGKTSHIAAHANNQVAITANDNSRPRLMKLQRNLERLGVENVEYILKDATQLTRTLPEESYDAILLDAPCSGEGMMILDNKKDFESWSVAHIKRLQQLQKKLIVQAWQLLKPGGTLVYSTCTMAPEENEAVVDYLLRHNRNAEVMSLDTLAKDISNRVSSVETWNGKTYDARLQNALRLKPSPTIEAFFVIKLKKV